MCHAYLFQLSAFPQAIFKPFCRVEAYRTSAGRLWRDTFVEAALRMRLYVCSVVLLAEPGSSLKQRLGRLGLVWVRIPVVVFRALTPG